MLAFILQKIVSHGPKGKFVSGRPGLPSEGLMGEGWVKRLIRKLLVRGQRRGEI